MIIIRLLSRLLGRCVLWSRRLSRVRQATSVSGLGWSRTFRHHFRGDSGLGSATTCFLGETYNLQRDEGENIYICIYIKAIDRERVGRRKEIRPRERRDVVDNEAGSNERKRMRKEVVDGESERARGRDRKRKRGNLHFAKPQSQFIQTAVKRTAEQWDKKTALMVLWLASYAFNNLYYV